MQHVLQSSSTPIEHFWSAVHQRSVNTWQNNKSEEGFVYGGGWSLTHEIVCSGIQVCVQALLRILSEGKVTHVCLSVIPRHAATKLQGLLNAMDSETVPAVKMQEGLKHLTHDY